MMTQAFYTGLSGIQSNQYAIDVVSDNMANISTVGYRGSEYEFASLFENSIASAVNTNSNTVGIGSRVQATGLKTAQGVLALTDRSTDLAILGDGWFGIQNGQNQVYTRDGSFGFDQNNDLVSLDGFHVLGTMGGNIENGRLTNAIDELYLSDIGSQQELNFPQTLVYPPEATTNAKFLGNLGTDDAVRTMGASAVDSENNKNHIKLSFSKAELQESAGMKWDVIATVESLDGETVYNTQQGQVFFDDRGALVSTTLSTIDNNGTPVSIDLGSGFNGVVSINNRPITASSTADGTIGGDLAGYSINKNAEVIATFSNGAQSSVGKIAVYHFQNDQGLERLNGSKFSATPNSGDPLFYKNAEGQNIIGTDIVNFQLEGSNIDMTYGLTELIVLQRSYDANSKSIATANELMQKALNMDA